MLFTEGGKQNKYNVRKNEECGSGHRTFEKS